jgi:diguanylate cyclase (GGDEF)-like protein
LNLRYRRRLVQLANLDGLTALPNRRRTVELAGEALRHADQSGRTVTVALLDFDHFKQINDRCGHAAGDHALKEFARLAKGMLRSGDTLGRWGGEEFLLVLPDCPLDRAYASVERLRNLALSIQLPSSGTDLRISLSAGLATNAKGPRSLDEIIASADVALYEAKAAGRDLVRIARDSLAAASTGVRRALTEDLAHSAAR